MAWCSCHDCAARTASCRRCLATGICRADRRAPEHAEWTAQQFRMIVVGDQPHRLVIHDRDAIYSEGVDRTLAAIGVTVLKTPVRAPQVNAFCERLIGTIRRECLDFMIPLNEPHLRRILRRWVDHYNRGRPHARLGPGIPERPPLDEAIADSRGHWV